MTAYFVMSKRAYRKRKQQSDEDDTEDDTSELESKYTIEELKLFQKLRQRKRGLDAVALAIGESRKDFSCKCDDPFLLANGGFIDMKLIKSRDLENVMQGNFARETNQRDEDAEMHKFIEAELKKRKGIKDDEEVNQVKPVDDTILKVSRYLITNNSQHKSEEMLSEQMLSGIPEIDLGVQEKIRNIEETEQMKQKLLEKLKEKKVEDFTLVPQNMAVNFVQHNRFTTDIATPVKTDEACNDALLRQTSKSISDKRPASSDQYLYDKFKRMTKKK